MEGKGADAEGAVELSHPRISIPLAAWPAGWEPSPNPAPTAPLPTLHRDLGTLMSSPHRTGEGVCSH